MAYNTVNWTFSGLPDKNEADWKVKEMEEWFIRSHPNHKSWAWTSTIQQGPFGWRAVFEARLETDAV